MNALTFAYFSMEFAVDPAMPTYSGGLGILAGDTMRTAADLGLPAVGVTLLHRRGYFRQHLDEDGNQSESEAAWSPEEFLDLLPPRARINIAGRQVQVQVWRYLLHGEFGHTVPVYFLDTSVTENDPRDKCLTDYLYGGDERYRLCQEVVLGFGGVAVLRALGYMSVQAYHVNEGHSALVPLALLEEQIWGRGLHTTSPADIEAVRQHCVFTTHTPMPIGHDEFQADLVRDVLGEEWVRFLTETRCCVGVMNMTNLAQTYSRYVNGVSMRHEEVARDILSNHRVGAITNGVRALTWTSPTFCRLFDSYIPQWRRDSLYLKYAVRIPLDEIWKAHHEAKQALLAEIERRTGTHLNLDAMTIGFARRATEYKRPDLLFHDLDRLSNIGRQIGRLQVIYGGKAHPRDENGKALIRRVFEGARALHGLVPVVFLEDYDMALAAYLCSGVDLWMNTPLKPQEASGTSGMKAALNGVPTFSIMDGWWIEGHVEGVTGWSIDESWKTEANTEREASSLYDKLERVILPMFYGKPDRYAAVMRSTIALNGSFFNTQRMVSQYMKNAYLPAGTE